MLENEGCSSQPLNITLHAARLEVADALVRRVYDVAGSGVLLHGAPQDVVDDRGCYQGLVRPGGVELPNSLALSRADDTVSSACGRLDRGLPRSGGWERAGTRPTACDTGVTVVL